MKKNHTLLLACCIIWGSLLACRASAARGTELFIAAQDVKAGNDINIPIMLDKVEKLAGVKLKITYDPAALTFIKAAKTKKTSSLMHIVNDKKPGVLIVVMAGAVGISGENFAILTLAFKTNKALKNDIATTMKITEAQLMNDRLQDIKFDTRVGPLTISTRQAPAEGSAHPPGSNSALPAPHTGHTQSSGRSSKAVPGSMPLSGSPTAGS